MPITQDMKNLTEDIEISHGERISWLTDVIKDSHQITKDANQMMNRISGENKEAASAVTKLLSYFRNDHKLMAQTLADFLAESESTRAEDFKRTLSSIQARQKDREEEVSLLMKRFEDELSEMASNLKAFLGKSEQRRLAEFKKMLEDIKSEQRAREEEVAELLDGFQKDIKGARFCWQNLAKTMASKRSGKPFGDTQGKGVAKKVEEAAEGAFEEGDLKAKALALIKESSKGISLSKLGSKLGVSYVRLARPIRKLQDEGKVVKRDSLYFPV